jgi:hypothetical protein
VGGGVRIPGIYQAMLEKERRRCAESDPRRIYSSEPDDPSPVYRRPRVLLEGLEGGKPALMARWMVGSRRSTPPVDLPWDRESVRTVRVSPDDVVSPADGECSWPGSVTI